MFSYDFSLDFFCLFLYAYQSIGAPFCIQISLSLLEEIHEKLESIQDSEAALMLIKEFPKSI